MPGLTFDDVRQTLPDLVELRPLLDHLLAGSEPDPGRRWSGSGELETVGARLVPHASLGSVVQKLAAAETRRLEDLYGRMARVLGALADGDRPAAAHTLLEAARVEEDRGRPDGAEAFAAAAFRLARGERDQRPAALALRRWARAGRASGRLEDAQRRYTKAHEIALAVSDSRGAAEAAIGTGNVLEEQGRWNEAARWYRRALDVLGEASEPAPERWQALLNLHIVLRSSGRIEDSIGLLEEAERAAHDSGSGPAAAFIENAWGQLEAARGEFGLAQVRHEAALAAADGTLARVTIQLNLAEALLAQGRTLDAKERAREAEHEAIRARLVRKLPEVYRMLGRIGSAEGSPDAFVFFERALDIARAHGLPALEEAVTLQAYAECEARRGEQQAAEELFRHAAARREELGIVHPRHAWADVFGPARPEQPPNHHSFPGGEGSA